MCILPLSLLPVSKSEEVNVNNDLWLLRGEFISLSVNGGGRKNGNMIEMIFSSFFKCQVAQEVHTIHENRKRCFASPLMRDKNTLGGNFTDFFYTCGCCSFGLVAFLTEKEKKTTKKKN